MDVLKTNAHAEPRSSTAQGSDPLNDPPFPPFTPAPHESSPGEYIYEEAPNSNSTNSTIKELPTVSEKTKQQVNYQITRRLHWIHSK